MLVYHSSVKQLTPCLLDFNGFSVKTETYSVLIVSTTQVVIPTNLFRGADP